MRSAWRRIGVGQTGFYSEEDPVVEGRLKVVETIDDIQDLIEKGRGDEIVLTSTAGATDFALVLHQIRGIVCTRGGLTCHLAILARENGVPCLFGARIDSRDGLDGLDARIELSRSEGIVYVGERESPNDRDRRSQQPHR